MGKGAYESKKATSVAHQSRKPGERPKQASPAERGIALAYLGGIPLATCCVAAATPREHGSSDCTPRVALEKLAA